MKRILTIILCALLIFPALAGCGRLNVSLGGIGGTRFDVNDSKELDAAGAESIRISTVSDDIIVKSGGDKVRAELTGECRSTTKPVWLDARRDGDDIIIEVKYPAIITRSDTTLTVTIPDGFDGDFTAHTVSGDIAAQGLPFHTKQVSLSTVSGNIDFDTASFESMKADSISGEISIGKIAAAVEANSTSGEITLDCDEFAGASASTVSGSVSVTLPQKAAFSVDFSSVSGDFSSTHAAIAVSNADGGFEADANGGGKLLKVNTTSGDLRLTGK